jgi:hypothetical protein
MLPLAEEIHRLYSVSLYSDWANRLGKRVTGKESASGFFNSGYLDVMNSIEALYAVVQKYNPNWKSILTPKIDGVVQEAIHLSETDIGIQFVNGFFIPSGSKLLDDKLINDSLLQMNVPEFASVLAPFEKGLRDFIDSAFNPLRLKDSITDVYESLEALAKIITGRDKDLSANRELFISTLGLNVYYRNILGQYIEYACEFRHGQAELKPTPERNEVETFIYLTGIFIRLAIKQHQNMGKKLA